MEQVVVEGIRKVVLVEDHGDLLRTMQLYLAAHGHAVWTADNGSAGVRQIAVEQPDVAFCDLHLPGWNGYRLARIVRCQGLSQVRLIAMTADAEVACASRAQAAGFEAILIKPVPLEEMLRLVRSPLASHRPEVQRSATLLRSRNSFQEFE